MTPEEFNKRELEKGRINFNHITHTVKCFQRCNDLVDDGKLGENTRKKIENPYQKSYPELVLYIAKNEIGNGETRGNNQGPSITKYRRGLNKSDSWCAWFVSWCLEEACKEMGLLMFVPPGKWKRNWRGAKRLFKTVKKNGGTSIHEPEPGALVLWNRGALNDWRGHIGIACSYLSDKNKFYVIEGNKGSFPSEVDTFSHVMGEANLLGFLRLPDLQRV